MKIINLIVKLAERCNLNCSYCYVFNQGNESFRLLPARLNKPTREKLPEFTANIYRDTEALLVRVIFHGGEPLLISKTDFDLLCASLIRVVPQGRRIEFSIQTNGVLVNKEWAELFAKYKIAVGVSLDGDRSQNVARVFRNGKQSYDEALRGWRLLANEATSSGRRPPTVLCAITGEQTLRSLDHFLSLGVLICDLIMPSQTHEATSNALIDEVGNVLPKLFAQWWDQRSHFTVKSFKYITDVMVAGARGEALIARASHDVLTISVDTAGGLSPDSSLLPANLYSNASIHEDGKGVNEYLATPIGKEISEAERGLPTACQECAWRLVCRGQGGSGNLINRYSVANRFLNKSIFCDALKKLYTKAVSVLVSHGVGHDHIALSLGVSIAELEDAISS